MTRKSRTATWVVSGLCVFRKEIRSHTTTRERSLWRGPEKKHPEKKNTGTDYGSIAGKGRTWCVGVLGGVVGGGGGGRMGVGFWGGCGLFKENQGSPPPVKTRKHHRLLRPRDHQRHQKHISVLRVVRIQKNWEQRGTNQVATSTRNCLSLNLLGKSACRQSSRNLPLMGKTGQRAMENRVGALPKLRHD